MTIPIERIRELLGTAAQGRTDDQLLQLRDQLEGAANAFYDEVQAAWNRDPETVLWMVHAHKTGETE